jgi:serine/threonine protein kinase
MSGCSIYLFPFRAIGNHPNVVQFLGTFKDKQTQYMVLEYCHRGSLREYLHKEGDKIEQNSLLQM